MDTIGNGAEPLGSVGMVPFAAPDVRFPTTGGNPGMELAAGGRVPREPAVVVVPGIVPPIVGAVMAAIVALIGVCVVPKVLLIAADEVPAVGIAVPGVAVASTGTVLPVPLASGTVLPPVPMVDIGGALVAVLVDEDGLPPVPLPEVGVVPAEALVNAAEPVKLFADVVILPGEIITVVVLLAEAGGRTGAPTGGMAAATVPLRAGAVEFVVLLAGDVATPLVPLVDAGTVPVAGNGPTAVAFVTGAVPLLTEGAVDDNGRVDGNAAVPLELTLLDGEDVFVDAGDVPVVVLPPTEGTETVVPFVVSPVVAVVLPVAALEELLVAPREPGNGTIEVALAPPVELVDVALGSGGRAGNAPAVTFACGGSAGDVALDEDGKGPLFPAVQFAEVAPEDAESEPVVTFADVRAVPLAALTASTPEVSR